MRGATIEQVRKCQDKLIRLGYVVGVDVLPEETPDDRHTLEATLEGQRVPPDVCNLLYHHDLGVYRCAPQGPDHLTLLAR